MERLIGRVAPFRVLFYSVRQGAGRLTFSVGGTVTFRIVNIEY